eukprot:scaffold118220_cov53-Attheya_sp.AAC.3
MNVIKTREIPFWPCSTVATLSLLTIRNMFRRVASHNMTYAIELPNGSSRSRITSKLVENVLFWPYHCWIDFYRKNPSTCSTQEVFHKSEIEAIELRILNTTDWKLHPPTPFNFVRKCLRMLVNAEAPSQRELFNRLLQHTRYLCELAACDYDTVSQYPPSRIAI